MNKKKLEDQLVYEIDWRIKELTTIKVFPLNQNLTVKEMELILKFSIPNIYSTWEGFVKAAFREYCNEINALGLSYENINNNILSHFFDMKYPQFSTGINKKFESKCDFFDGFLLNLNKPVLLETKLPTESNINFKVINTLLTRFNLVVLDVKYKAPLDKLLMMRNRAAHGDHSIPITQTDLDDNIKLITDLMDIIMYRIIDGCDTKGYLK